MLITDKEGLLEFLNNLDLSVYKHASNIVTKYNNWKKLSVVKKNALPIIANQYYNFINGNNEIIGYSNEIIEQRTALLNQYYDFINVNNYDNVFTSQGKFRPTILEEFMYILFKDLIIEVRKSLKNSNDNLKVGSSRA